MRALGPPGVFALPAAGPFQLDKLRFCGAITRLERRFADQPARRVCLTDLLREFCVEAGVSIEQVFTLSGNALEQRNSKYPALASVKKGLKKKPQKMPQQQ